MMKDIALASAVLLLTTASPATAQEVGKPHIAQMKKLIEGRQFQQALSVVKTFGADRGVN